MVEQDIKEVADAVFIENKNNWRFHIALWFFSLLGLFVGIVKLSYYTIRAKITQKK